MSELTPEKLHLFKGYAKRVVVNHTVNSMSFSSIESTFNLKKPPKKNIYVEADLIQEYILNELNSIEVDATLNHNAMCLKYSDGVRGGDDIYQDWALIQYIYESNQKLSATEPEAAASGIMDFLKFIDYQIQDKNVIYQDIKLDNTSARAAPKAMWKVLMSKTEIKGSIFSIKRKILTWHYSRWCNYMGFDTPRQQYSTNHIPNRIDAKLISSFLDGDIDWVTLCEKWYDLQMDIYLTYIKNKASGYKMDKFKKEK